jgi:tryptophan synthase alpha chain
MTNRYETRFSQLKASGEKAFIPFTLLGWPNRRNSLQIIQAMIESGAAALELGLAFSDPIADGPTIQKAAFETLASGFKVSDALELIREVRKIDEQIPIGLLVYYNMVLAKGPEQFFAGVAEAGVDGVLIADLPVESADELQDAARKAGVEMIFIVSPLTDEHRLAQILQHAGAFLYLVSRLGITGVQERYDSHLKAIVASVHKTSHLPVCVGFGVSTPEQAHSMLELGADGVITGSRIIEIVSETGSEFNLQNLKDYLNSMVNSVQLTAVD